MRRRMVLAGSLAQKPRHGGHTWVFLQYLLGFRRLGWDVLFLDRLDPAASADAAGRACPPEESVQFRFLADVMDRFGLTGCYAADCRGRYAGLSRAEVLERTGAAAFLLNVMGFLTDAEVLARWGTAGRCSGCGSTSPASSPPSPAAPGASSGSPSTSTRRTRRTPSCSGRTGGC